MSEFEGRGRGFERGHASAVAKKREAREQTPAEKATDAKAIAGNLAGSYQRVTQNVAAMRTAAETGDRPGWDTAKAAAESGAKDLDRIAKAALAAAPDATEPEVREQLAGIEQLQTDVETLLASAAPAPAPRAPVVSCADALLGALPPDDPSWQPDHERDATEAKIARIFDHELVYSDIDALTRLLRDHPEHAITRRFERVGKTRRVRLLGRFEKPKFKADAREREARHRATTPSRERADADHDEVAAAPAPSIEENRISDPAPALPGQDTNGAADRQTAVESDAATLGAAPSTAASGAARAALGSRIAVAAGATYPGEGVFQIPELPAVLITVQRTAAATPRRRRTANEIVLEIPRGLADEELARVAIEQLTLLREESTATTEDAAADGVRDAAEPLPHHEQIQRSFGEHRIDHVRAQVGGPAADAAAQLGATAYATGDRVGFADSPSLHTAAHEAAHVVQQRAGVALKGDVGEAGDAYEQHADAVADRVVRGESAEELLDEMAPRASGTGGAANAVQRKEQGAQPTRATAAAGEHTLVRKPDQKWHVFAESGKPYIIESRNGKPGAWVIRDWVKAAPDRQQTAGGYTAPSCARDLLAAMGWVEPERLEVAAARLIFRFTRTYDYLPMGANAMNATGLPAGTDAVAERGNGGALKTTIRLDDPSLPPGTEHAMTASEQTRAVRALAEFTGLEVAPDGLRFLQPVISAARQMTGNGALFFEWDRTVCRTLFGFDAYERWQTGKQPDADRDERTPKLKLSNYYQRPIPGELSHHADIVESGEQIRLEALVNWPVDPPNPAIYEIVPMVTPSKFGTVALLQCNWRFERISAGTKSASPAAPAAAASAAMASAAPAARATSTAGPASTGAATAATASAAQPASPVASTVSPGATPEQAATETAEVFHRFKLAPGEASATFRVTCDARFDAYFTPTTFTRDVVVMSSDVALSSLRTAAFAGLGGDDAARGGSAWTADASAALTTSPPTGSTDTTARGRATQRTQLEAVRAHLGNNPASADAVAAIDRELARQAKTEQLLAQDRARGWQPFQLRGTYLSRTEGLASGPLDLHGTVHVVPHYDSSGDGGATTISMRSDQYVVQIRDLSRRFEQQDFTFEGRGATFDRALSDAFEDLAVAYPKGMLAIEAEQLASRAGAADGEALVGARTGKVAGFQRSTETTWKKVKETVWDPVASLAVNLGAIALMTLVPGSAAIVAPAIIAYNSIPAVDRIATEADRGTLTTGKFATAAGEIALNLLPVVGRARPFTAGWFAIETANWGGQVALMTASAIDTARGLQAQQVAALAAEYEAFLQLQKRSLPSDPNLAAAEAAIRARATAVADMISKQIVTQIRDNGIVMVTGSVIHHTAAHARTAIVDHLSRRVPNSDSPDASRALDSAPPPPGHGGDAAPQKSGTPDDRTATPRSDHGVPAVRDTSADETARMPAARDTSTEQTRSHESKTRKNATTANVDARVSLTAAGDQFAEFAKKVPPDPGYFDVVVHGTSDAFYIFQNDAWVAFKPNALRTWLKKKGHDRAPIRLLSCETGAHSNAVAQSIANGLGVWVKAPTDIIWISDKGAVTIGPDPHTNTGGWIPFKPYGTQDKDVAVTSREPDASNATNAVSGGRRERRERENRNRDRERSQRTDQTEEALDVAGETGTRRAPIGMTDKQFQRFKGVLHDEFAKLGINDIKAVVAGSAYTGRGHESGRSFDDGRVSDYDVALVSPTLVELAIGRDIKLAGPLSDLSIHKLGLNEVQERLSLMAERPVNFMLMRDAELPPGILVERPVGDTASVDTGD